MYTGTRPGVSPAIRAEKGWRGTPGACSQVFCHSIRCMLYAFISTETCSLYHRQNHNHHNNTTTKQQLQQQQAQTGCALTFFAQLTESSWTETSWRELRSEGESGGCVRGIVTSSRPSAWPLPRIRTTQLYGDRRWQGPGGGNEQYYRAKFRNIPPPRRHALSTFPLDRRRCACRLVAA